MTNFKDNPSYRPTRVIRSDGATTTVYKGSAPVAPKPGITKDMPDIDMNSTAELRFAKDVAQLFEQHGIPIFLVGGAVRDHLNGKVIDDFDFSTPVDVETTKAAAEQIGDVWELGGEAHGTVAFNFGGEKIEVTTFRTETYDGDRKNPNVTFIDNIEEDLARRDFTMNAMAIDPSNGTLIDPYNGREDMETKVLNTPGEPYDRFFEDPLRVTRAIRFCARDGYVMSDEVREAAERIVNEGMLSTLSRERHTQEIEKINKRSADALGDAMLLAIEMGAFEEIFDPGIEFPEALATRVRHLKNPDHRIVEMLLGGGDVNRMKLPTDYQKTADAVAELYAEIGWDEEPNDDPELIAARSIYRHGTKALEYFAGHERNLFAATAKRAMADAHIYKKDSEYMLKGGDITDMGSVQGLKPGAWISETKKHVDGLFIESKGTMTMDEMREAAAQKITELTF